MNERRINDVKNNLGWMRIYAGRIEEYLEEDDAEEALDVLDRIRVKCDRIWNLLREDA